MRSYVPICKVHGSTRNGILETIIECSVVHVKPELFFPAFWHLKYNHNFEIIFWDKFVNYTKNTIHIKTFELNWALNLTLGITIKIESLLWYLTLPN